MRVLGIVLAALIVAAALVSPASALPPGYPDCCCVPKPQAPDACGCGFWCYSPCGMAYGPSYNVYPPFMPWNGVVPVRNGGGVPSQPYARSPRDYFMYEDLGRR